MQPGVPVAPAAQASHPRKPWCIGEYLETRPDRQLGHPLQYRDGRGDTAGVGGKSHDCLIVRRTLVVLISAPYVNKGSTLPKGKMCVGRRHGSQAKAFGR